MEVNKIICGDWLEVGPTIPTGSINCCVTSPPYWGLRDYGVDGQLGLEKTPEEFIAGMVAVFAEVWRVLRDDGTLWLNMGDSYAGSGKGGQSEEKRSENWQPTHANKGVTPPGLKPKDLCGMPWRLAFALQAEGWYLRQDIIWHKPNPMPESVRDRCTKAHEYIFLMTKKPRYYYDADAIREDSIDPESFKGRDFRQATAIIKAGARPNQSPNGFERGCAEKIWPKRNKRSVWTVTTKPYSEAHFATFPPDLIRQCILAGCPKEVCKKCGKPRVRMVEKKASTMNIRIRDSKKGILDKKSGGKATATEIDNYGKELAGETKTTGWTDCGCGEGFRPGVVLDPFMGSGTVAEVAAIENRDYVGCELNQEYIDLGRVQAVETGVPVKEARAGQGALFS